MESSDFPDEEYTELDDPVHYGKQHNDQGYVNERYGVLITDFMRCTTQYLNDFPYPQHLEKQLDRLDLDTVCAYEIYQMKKEFTKTNILDLSQFVQKF